MVTETKGMGLFQYVRHIGFVPCLLLFLNLLNPFGYDYVFGYLIIAYLIFFHKKDLLEHLDKDVIFLLLFSVFYSAFNFFGDNKGAQYLVIQAIFPFFFYLFGKKMMSPKLSPKNTWILLIILGFVFSLTGLFSVGMEILKNGFVIDIEDRSIPNFWTGELILATGMSSYFIYNLVVPGLLATNRSKINLPNIVALTAIFIVSLLCIFRLGSRTGIVIAGTSLFVAAIITLVKENLLGKIKFIIGSTVVIVLIIYLIPFDLDADYLSVLGDRLRRDDTSSSTSAGGRTQLWAEALNNMFKYPFGWELTKHSHNLWLDTARAVGLIPLAFLLGFTYFNIKRTIQMFNYQKNVFFLNMTFLLFILSNLLLFFVEPVYEGSFFFFNFYCFLSGILKRYVELGYHAKNEKKSKNNSTYAHEAIR